MARYDIVGQKLCECGCRGIIYLKGWHFEKTGVIPRFIVGHNKECFFRKGNKVGWKGGEVKQNGYVLVYQPNHPNHNAQSKGYVRRARLVLEKYLGRYLEDWEIVHHIDGIRDHDVIENLIIMTNSSHLSLHHKGKKFARKGNGQFAHKGGDVQ